MDNSEHDSPPRLVLAFFRWFCHPEFREDIEGDLLERFHNRKTKLGVRKAKWLFIIDVLLLFRPGIIRNLRSVMQSKLFTMKTADWIKLAMISISLIAVIISPFMPGPSNNIVIGLSVFGQSAGFFGLALVPIGIIWAIVEIRNLRNKNNESFDWRRAYAIVTIGTAITLAIVGLSVVGLKAVFFGPLLIIIGIVWTYTEIKNLNANNENYSWRHAYSLAIIATTIITGICLLAAMALFIGEKFIASIIVLISSLLVLKLTITEVKKLKNPSVKKFHTAPFYLFIIPLVALATRIYLMEPLSDYSRNMAIERGQVLIEAIENYKIKEGQYPESIQDLEKNYLTKIPSPSIMGILDFRYNKINDQYSLSFSQWLDFGSLEEIVLYDKSDLKNNLTGEYAKYNYKFDLCRVKGAFASHDTTYDHWRYYLVD